MRLSYTFCLTLLSLSSAFRQYIKHESELIDLPTLRCTFVNKTLFGGSCVFVVIGDYCDLFLQEECIFMNQILPLEYFYQPISIHKGKYPLRGCVVALSGYGRKERIFLMEVTNILGGL